jgi:hypothetical protein
MELDLIAPRDGKGDEREVGEEREGGREGERGGEGERGREGERERGRASERGKGITPAETAPWRALLVPAGEAMFVPGTPIDCIASMECMTDGVYEGWSV